MRKLILTVNDLAGEVEIEEPCLLSEFPCITSQDATTLSAPEAHFLPPHQAYLPLKQISSGITTRRGGNLNSLVIKFIL